MNLSVPAKREGVVFLPGRASGGMVVKMTFAETTVLLSNASKTARFPMLVDRVGDPVDSGVTADSLVVRVDKNDFVIFVDTILVDPVRVQDAKIAASSSNTLLSNRSKTTLEFEVVNTLADGFTVGCTLGDGFLAVTTADTNTVNDISLLSLVT